jgi:putative PEP-CTERM system TPR-repeat lipoprotein
VTIPIKLAVCPRPAVTRTLICAATAVGLMAVLTSLTACDAFGGPDKRVARAEVLLAHGDYRRAMTELKTALEKDPGHVGARTALARLSLDLGDAESAQKELDRARQTGTDNAELRTLAAQTLIARGRFEDAERTLQTDESIPALRRWTLLATAQAELGKHADAQRSVAEALRIDPNDSDALLEQARILMNQERFDEALVPVNRVIQKAEQSSEAWRLRGSIYALKGDFAQAAAAFEKGLEVGSKQLNLPRELALLNGLADSQLTLRDTKGATDTLARLEARFPNAVSGHYLRARLALLGDDYKAAIAELQQVLRAAPDATTARLLLGIALLSQGTLEQAEAELSKLLTEHPENIAVRKALAQVYLARQRPDAARRTLAEAGEPVRSDAQFDWLMATALIQTGSEKEGIDRLEKSVASMPNQVEGRIRLARAYLASGRTAEATAQLESLPQEARNAEVQRLLFFAKVAGKEPAAAKAHIEQLLAANPKDASLAALAGEYSLGQGDLGSARAYLTGSLALEPDNVSVRLILAQLEARESKLDEAEKQLHRILEIEPGHQGAYLGLSGLALLRGDRPQAMKVLEQAIAANPAAVETRLQLAQLAFLDHDPKRARSLLEQALTVATDRAELLNAVGEVLMHAGQLDDALARFNEAVAAGSQRATINLARVQHALGRTEEARRTLEAALNVRPIAAQAAAMLIEMNARAGRTADARRLIAKLPELGFPTFAINELQGDVELTAGRFAEAVNSYEKAARERPSSLLAIKTFRALQSAHAAHPERVLQRRLEDAPDDRFVRRILAEYHLRSGNRQEAIREYERLADMQENDPTVLNNLAWLYFESGDQRAMQLARRAFEAAPTVGEIADTYGWVLVQGGQRAEGLKVLEQAAARAPQNAEIRYHLASAYAATGDKKEATAMLTTLLQSGEHFASRTQADDLLRSLSSN